VAELFLDDFQVSATGLVKMRRVGAPAGVGGVAGIQVNSRDETLAKVLEPLPDGGTGLRLPEVQVFAQNISMEMLTLQVHLGVSPSGSSRRHSARLPSSTPTPPHVPRTFSGGPPAHRCLDPGVPERLAPPRHLHWVADVES
jgi:hypothetical protein